MTYCDCDGPPWPEMARLHVGGPFRWFVCPKCSTIRQEIVNPDGTTAGVRYHELDAERLPVTVAAEARAILEQPKGEQLSLWGENEV